MLLGIRPTLLAVLFAGFLTGSVVLGALGSERKAKARTYRLGFDANLLPFKSAAQLQYLPETSHNTWTNFRGQDHNSMQHTQPATRPKYEGCAPYKNRNQTMPNDWKTCLFWD